MLIKYRFDNFCSFRDGNEFSLETAAGKVRKRYPENYVDFQNGISCLKSAVIVGENAGGKSNFIGSLRFLKSLFENNSAVRSVRSLINSVSLLENKLPRQSFEIVLVADNEYIYEYHLVIDEKGISSEELYQREKKRLKNNLVFKMARNSERSAYEYSGSEENILKGLGNSGSQGIGLFITKLALLGNEHAMAVTNWMTNTLYTETLSDQKSRNVRKQEDDLKILNDPRYIDIFRMVDYSISGIELDEERPYEKTVIIREDSNHHVMKRELQMDSTGVREFFAWAVQIFRVVYENKIIFADEMDRVLNPVLSDRVIAYINGKTHHGQFIFSTHNVLHLNLVTYMKEQIYFVTKNKDTLTSEIYSLADFPEVRYQNPKIYEFYMKGILGGTAVE